METNNNNLFKKTHSLRLRLKFMNLNNVLIFF